jgi:hypothetical protein
MNHDPDVSTSNANAHYCASEFGCQKGVFEFGLLYTICREIVLDRSKSVGGTRLAGTDSLFYSCARTKEFFILEKHRDRCHDDPNIF